MNDSVDDAEVDAEQALPHRTNPPYDAPDAATLIDAVRSYLHDDLMPRSSGADRWLLRVAANALTIAAREITLGPEHHAAHGERLASLGVSSDRELSEAIRAGAFDDRWAEVAVAVRASVADSLSVANPDYAV
jgi:hypothetical protein